jgi:hypothetical protein
VTWLWIEKSNIHYRTETAGYGLLILEQDRWLKVERESKIKNSNNLMILSTRREIKYIRFQIFTVFLRVVFTVVFLKIFKSSGMLCHVSVLQVSHPESQRSVTSEKILLYTICLIYMCVYVCVFGWTSYCKGLTMRVVKVFVFPVLLLT